ncbi:MAG: DUF3179 domain-containing (seleno)protein [Alphaproteobacteria bacterium]
MGPNKRWAWVLVLAGVLLAPISAGAQSIFDFAREFPLTDFSKRSINLGEIFTGSPRRGSFPTIDDPKFVAVGEIDNIGPLEPVLSLIIDGDARAYPLRMLLFHELVNDVVGGVPVLVSYCPLCNSGVVYDRRLDGETLSFDNTGRLRHFDMVIYDRQSESWWQQFLGEAMVGERTGQRLRALPARLESLGRFEDRAPEGLVLVPENENMRPYGTSGNEGVDDIPPALARERYPFPLPDGVSPLERLIVVGDEAWTLELVRTNGQIERGDLVLTWEAGQNSIHDDRLIRNGRDVGNVIVQRRTAAGLSDVVYDVSFAYAFAAFVPDGVIHQE